MRIISTLRVRARCRRGRRADSQHDSSASRRRRSAEGCERRPTPASQPCVLQPGTGKDRPRADRDRHRPLHRLDHRRQDVRQLGRPRRADQLSVESRDPRMDRRRSADGDRREAPPVDPRGARLQGTSRQAEGHARLRRRAPRHADPRAGRRQGATRRRQAHVQRPRLQSADDPAPASFDREPPARSWCITPAGRTDGKMFDSSVVRGAARHVPAERRDPRVDRRAAVDGRRREDAVLDSRQRWPTKDKRMRRRARWCSTSSCFG